MELQPETESRYLLNCIQRVTNLLFEVNRTQIAP